MWIIFADMARMEEISKTIKKLSDLIIMHRQSFQLFPISLCRGSTKKSSMLRCKASWPRNHDGSRETVELQIGVSLNRIECVTTMWFYDSWRTTMWRSIFVLPARYVCHVRFARRSLCALSAIKRMSTKRKRSICWLTIPNRFEPWIRTRRRSRDSVCGRTFDSNFAHPKLANFASVPFWHSMFCSETASTYPRLSFDCARHSSTIGTDVEQSKQIPNRHQRRPIHFRTVKNRLVDSEIPNEEDARHTQSGR